MHKFWNWDLSFLESKPRDDPIYSANGKSGCYNYILCHSRRLIQKSYGLEVRSKCDSNHDMGIKMSSDELNQVTKLVVAAHDLLYNYHKQAYTQQVIWNRKLRLSEQISAHYACKIAATYRYKTKKEMFQLK